MSRVVVVTGSSAGVGRAAAVRFAAEGDAVALIARGSAGLEGAAKEVERAGGRAVPVEIDVADAAAVAAAAKRIESELGTIDVWVNNAMVTVFAPVWKVTPEEFRRVMEINYLGGVYGTLAALDGMRRRNRGVIINVGSALAYRAIPLQSAYCASKHALRGFTDSLRTELAHEGSGVRVVSVHLPALNTPQFSWSRAKMPKHPQPVPPIFPPEMAAEGILLAAEHPRREVWVGRRTLLAIAGNKIAPWYLDRRLAREGYHGQLTEMPLEPGRRDNLYAPVDDDAGGDAGTAGIFDDQVQEGDWWWRLNERATRAVGRLRQRRAS
jgi:NAD(P)-dependent dehydrogenase (short-subunit alcohol dehydrogenase family)